MAVLGRDWVTLSTITDVQYVRKYYRLYPSSSGAPQPPTVNPPPSNSGWSLTEPSYTEGSTNSLYETMLIIFSNGTFDYLPVQKSSSYEAAKVAYNKSVAATNAANTAALAAAAEEAERTRRDSNFGYRYKADVIVFGDSDKFYPVTIYGGNQNVKRDIFVNRAYGEQGPNDWHGGSNSATHKGALTLKIKANFGGWGGASYSWEVHELEQVYSNTFGGARNIQSNMGFAIFLRGGGPGGAVYHIYSDQPLNNRPNSNDSPPYPPGPHPYYNGAEDKIYYYPVGHANRDNPSYIWPMPEPRPNPLASNWAEEIRVRKFIDLSKELDAKITTFYGSATPVNPKVGDLWFKTDKSLHRRTSNAWVVVNDAGLTAAVNQISAVQTIADGKIRTYAQNNPPTGLLPKDEGDIWLDTNDGNRMYRWDGATPGAWVPVRDLLIEAHEDALAEIEAEMLLAAGVADGTATVLVQSNTPTTAQRTPTTLWINVGDGGRPYRWNGTAWVRLANDGAVKAARKAMEALDLIDTVENELQGVKDDLDAAEAQQLLFQADLDAKQGTMTTLNKKVTVSHSPPPSTIAGYSAGDVWEQHNGTTSLGRWVVYGSVWTPFKAGINFLGEDSIGSAQIIETSIGTAHIAEGAITNAKIGDLNVGKLTVEGPSDFKTSFTENLIANEGFIKNLAATRVVVGASPNLIAHGKLTASADRTTGKWTPNQVGTGDGFTAWNASYGMGLTTGNSPATVGNVFNLEKGQKYKFSAKVRGGTSPATYWVAAQQVVVAQNGNITTGSTRGYLLSSRSAALAVTDVEGTWECTETGTYMLSFETANNTLYINDIRLSTPFSGVLIEDGTVVADHIKLDTLTGKTITGLNIQTSSLSNRGIKIVDNKLVAYDNTSSTEPKFTLNGTTGEVTSVGGTFTGAKVNGGQVTVGAVGSYPRIDMKDDLWLDFIGVRFHSNNASTGAEVKSNTAAYDDYGVGGLFMTSAKTAAGFGTELRLGTAKTELFINENGAFGSRLLLESAAVSMSRAGNNVFNATSTGTALMSGSTSLYVSSSLFYVSVGSSNAREFEATTSAINIRRAGNDVFSSNTTTGTEIRYGSSYLRATSAHANIVAATGNAYLTASGGEVIVSPQGSNTWTFRRMSAATPVASLRFTGQRTGMPQTTQPANLHMHTDGTIYYSSSSADSKVGVQDVSTDPALVLDVPVRDWFDKQEAELYTSFLDGDEDEEDIPGGPFRRIPGVIAEELEAAGLSQFVVYDTDGETPTGVMYDRLSLLLIPVVRDLRDRLDALEAHHG